SPPTPTSATRSGAAGSARGSPSAAGSAWSHHSSAARCIRYQELAHPLDRSRNSIRRFPVAYQLSVRSEPGDLLGRGSWMIVVAPHQDEQRRSHAPDEVPRHIEDEFAAVHPLSKRAQPSFIDLRMGRLERLRPLVEHRTEHRLILLRQPDWILKHRGAHAIRG